MRLDTTNADNVLDLLAGWEVVVDGADNFPSRYLLNDASVKLGIPVVHGSIFRFEGQVTVFDPLKGPTYRDYVPVPPPPELAPSCAEAGVLGVLPGVIGSLQALETIKLVLQLGDSLIGRLLAFDALDMTFREYKIHRDPKNQVTHENRDRINITEYDQYCSPSVNSSLHLSNRPRCASVLMANKRAVIGGGPAGHDAATYAARFWRRGNLSSATSLGSGAPRSSSKSMIATGGVICLPAARRHD